MNRVFRPRGYFTVADGTDVSPFLNATDVTQDDVPWGALGDMSIAAGRIGPRVHSWVHVHLAVTQVTYVISGRVTIRMKEPTAPEPYDLSLQAGEAVLTEPGTLFQLRNDNDAVADVLYLVSPSYVFEMGDGEVRHDDAILVAKSWDDLAARNDAMTMNAYDARARRAEALRRLAERKGVGPPPLSTDAVRPLKTDCDYLAPDGSEIRLLVAGEQGSLAHLRPTGRYHVSSRPAPDRGGAVVRARGRGRAVARARRRTAEHRENPRR